MNIASTAATEPELYLRMRGESQLITGISTFPGLGAIGSAFVATGLLELDVATAVVADYALAAQLRENGFGLWQPTTPAEQTRVAAPVAPVVALCRRTDEEDDRTWPYTVLWESFAEVATVYTGPANWNVVATRFPKPQGFPQSLQLADDSGRVVHARVQGSGDQRYTFIGRFVSDARLSQETQWLELGGIRVDLERQPAPKPTVESMAGTSAAVDFLRHRAATADLIRSRPPTDDPVVAAFIATGALAENDPVLAELASITRVVRFAPTAGLHRSGRMAAVGRATVSLTVANTTADVPVLKDLPPQWASLERPVTWSGPEAVVPLGVATPVLEETATVLIALTSEADRFRIDTLEIAARHEPRGDMEHVDPRPEFAYWAQDDRGDWYLGRWEAFESDDKGRRGDVTYYPAIDPQARTLTLYPTLRTCRAVVEVPLPWQPAA